MSDQATKTTATAEPDAKTTGKAKAGQVSLPKSGVFRYVDDRGGVAYRGVVGDDGAVTFTIRDYRDGTPVTFTPEQAEALFDAEVHTVETGDA